jgi:hypothetical protein
MNNPAEVQQMRIPNVVAEMSIVGGVDRDEYIFTNRQRDYERAQNLKSCAWNGSDDVYIRLAFLAFIKRTEDLFIFSFTALIPKPKRLSGDKSSFALLILCLTRSTLLPMAGSSSILINIRTQTPNFPLLFAFNHA